MRSTKSIMNNGIRKNSIDQAWVKVWNLEFEGKNTLIKAFVFLVVEFHDLALGIYNDVTWIQVAPWSLFNAYHKDYKMQVSTVLVFHKMYNLETKICLQHRQSHINDHKSQSTIDTEILTLESLNLWSQWRLKTIWKIWILQCEAWAMGNCERLEPQILCPGNKCDVQALYSWLLHIWVIESIWTSTNWQMNSTCSKMKSIDNGTGQDGGINGKKPRMGQLPVVTPTMALSH